MTQYENAQAVAAYMNDNPDVELYVWNDFASQHEMEPFDYGDDVWYRNEEYVVSCLAGRYRVESIDRYDVKRKTLWRALVKGEPVSDWVDSLGSALECAMNHVKDVEHQEAFEDPDISFEKKSVVI